MVITFQGNYTPYLHNVPHLRLVKYNEYVRILISRYEYLYLYFRILFLQTTSPYAKEDCQLTVLFRVLSMQGRMTLRIRS